MARPGSETILSRRAIAAAQPANNAWGMRSHGVVRNGDPIINGSDRTGASSGFLHDASVAGSLATFERRRLAGGTLRKPRWKGLGAMALLLLCQGRTSDRTTKQTCVHPVRIDVAAQRGRRGGAASIAFWSVARPALRMTPAAGEAASGKPAVIAACASAPAWRRTIPCRHPNQCQTALLAGTG